MVLSVKGATSQLGPPGRSHTRSFSRATCKRALSESLCAATDLQQLQQSCNRAVSRATCKGALSESLCAPRPSILPTFVAARDLLHCVLCVLVSKKRVGIFQPSVNSCRISSTESDASLSHTRNVSLKWISHTHTFTHAHTHVLVCARFLCILFPFLLYLSIYLSISFLSLYSLSLVLSLSLSLSLYLYIYIYMHIFPLHTCISLPCFSLSLSLSHTISLYLLSVCRGMCDVCVYVCVPALAPARVFVCICVFQVLISWT